ncbi:MAG: c-type cytochrome [Halioglobus sp.]
MFMRNRRRFVFPFAFLLSTLAASVCAGPQLGQPIKPEEWAAWDIDVSPDGAGLPSGAGIAEQGAVVYQRDCQACHGDMASGGLNVALAGRGPAIRNRTVGNYWPFATTLFDYIRRAMPLNQPQSLSSDDTYAVTAYLLFLNSIIPEDLVLDAASLPQIVMPNRESFDSSVFDSE